MNANNIFSCGAVLALKHPWRAFPKCNLDVCRHLCVAVADLEVLSAVVAGATQSASTSEISSPLLVLDLSIKAAFPSCIFETICLSNDLIFLS